MSKDSDSKQRKELEDILKPYVKEDAEITQVMNFIVEPMRSGFLSADEKIEGLTENIQRQATLGGLKFENDNIPDTLRDELTDYIKDKPWASGRSTQGIKNQITDWHNKTPEERKVFSVARDVLSKEEFQNYRLDSLIDNITKAITEKEDIAKVISEQIAFNAPEPREKFVNALANKMKTVNGIEIDAAKINEACQRMEAEGFKKDIEVDISKGEGLKVSSAEEKMRKRDKVKKYAIKLRKKIKKGASKLKKGITEAPGKAYRGVKNILGI